MVKHKSRLQVEKEQAVEQRKAEEAAQAQRAKRKVIHTPGSWSKQVCLLPHRFRCHLPCIGLINVHL